MYFIRVHAIATADDNGNNAATVTADEVEQIFQGANTVYGPAGLTFQFEKSIDFERRNSTLLNQDFDAVEVDTFGSKAQTDAEATTAAHDAERTKVAMDFPGQMVIFFRFGTFYKNEKTNHADFDSATNKFKAGPRHGGIGGPKSLYFLMQGNTEAELYRLFSHESGHFFHLPHTFYRSTDPIQPIKDADGNVVTSALAQATWVLQEYVTAHPDEQNPLKLFDGDADVVGDTPPDLGDGIFEEVHGNTCSDAATIDITVQVAGHAKTYTLAPDRSNAMSYFFRCPNQQPLNFTPDQAAIIKAAVETGNRRVLTGLSLKWGGWEQVQGGGHTDAAQSAVVFGKRLYLFAKGIADHEVYVISAPFGQPFGSWQKVHAGFKTNTAIGCCTFNNLLYAFATGAADGAIYVSHALDGQPFSAWQPMAGGGHTDGPVSGAALGGFPCATAKGIQDHGVYLNSSKDGQAFGNWSQVQGGHKTSAAPTIAASGQHLFVTALGLSDNRVYITSALPGKPFGAWSEVQGGAKTDAPVAMAVAGKRLCLFAKDQVSGAILINSAIDGQPFRGWDEVPGNMKTDTSPAAVQFQDYLYVFVKGLDQKHYVISAKIL